MVRWLVLTKRWTLIFRIFTVFTIIFLLFACEPEDGWCSSETHSGSDDFNCSQMDKDFSCTGESILSAFTDKVFTYRKSEIADGSDTETVMQRPEYIPETLTFMSISSCTLAPRFGGVTCKSWTEFTFDTEEKITFKASSRSEDNTVSPCDPKYLEFEIKDKEKEKELTGIKTSTGLFLNDTTLKNGSEIKVRHYFERD